MVTHPLSSKMVISSQINVEMGGYLLSSRMIVTSEIGVEMGSHLLSSKGVMKWVVTSSQVAFPPQFDG